MENLKRKASDDGEQSRSKKKAKQWRTPKKQSLHMAPTIEPGDAGIWATCDMHKEGRATIELRDLFEDYAQKIYGQSCLNSPPDGSGEERKGESGSLVQPSVDEEVHSENKDGSDADKTPVEENDPDDIESEIAREIRSIKQPSSSTTTSSAHPPKPLIQAVRIDTQCVLFFKTRPPVEPVSFVQTICQDLSDGKASRRSRCVRRLTPMTRMGKATVGGLESVGSTVIGEVFGAKSGLKFAIRPTIRNHATLKRDEVIQKVAALVGHDHSVDLKQYDFLILVDIYKNMMGMSVVGKDYEGLKRYNIAEIHDATKVSED